MSNENQNGGLGLPLVGGVIGGGGAYLASQKVDKVKQWVSEPRYNSFQDLVDEKDDEFIKTLEKGSDEEKALVAKRNEVLAAETKWETDKAEYIRNNTKVAPVEDTDEIKNLVKELEETKKVTLAEETAKLKDVTKGEAGELTIKKAIKGKANRKYNAVNHLERLKAEGASKEVIDAQLKRIAQIDKEIDELATTIAELGKYGGDEAAVKTAKDAVRKEVRSYADDIVTKKFGRVDAKAVKPTNPKIVDNVLTLRDNRSKFLAELKAKGDEIEKLTGLKFNEQAVMAPTKQGEKVNFAMKSVEHNIAKEDALVAALKDYKAKFVAAEGGKSFKFDAELIMNLLQGKVDGKDAVFNFNFTESTKLENFMKQLSDVQKKDLEKLLNGKEVSVDVLDELIKSSETRSKKLTEALDFYKNSGTKLTEIDKELSNAEKLVKYTYGTETYIKDGVLYDGKHKPIVDAPKTARVHEPKLSLPKEANIADSATIKIAATPLSEEEIAKRAAEAVDGNAKVKDLSSKIVAKRDALPKVAAKSETELVEEFIKANGKKEEAISNAAKNVGDDIVNNLKKLTKNSNVKLWGGVAACAAAGIALGALLRPKHKEQA